MTREQREWPENFTDVTLGMMEEFIMTRVVPELIAERDPEYRVEPKQIPDEAAIEYIANLFHRYFVAGGKITLDEAFGLKTRRGPNHPLKRREEYIRDSYYRDEMYRLLAIGFNRDEAAAAACAKDLETPLWTSGARSEISAKTLINKFTRAGGMRLLGTRPAYKEALAWSADQRVEFLRSFPQHLVPKRFGEVPR